MIIQRIILTYGWLNTFYFGYYFIKENQSLDDFISFFNEFYRFEIMKSLGILGGFISIFIGILTLCIMGLSVVATLRLIWIWFFTGEIKKEDFE